MQVSRTGLSRGFSLVELSIVLVILGLLVGGVLAGKSLIRASELRAVGAEYQRHLTALLAFRDKYQALPGDMAFATRVWGAQTGATTDGPVASCVALSTAATDKATCNGDGDGVIGNSQGGTNNEAYESYRYWQHLADAGLEEGSYIGVRDPATTTAALGISVPASKYPGGGWAMAWRDNATYPSGSKFSLYYGNSFTFGAVDGNTPDMQGPLLTPEDAWNIDSKYDDGLPGQGKFITYMNNGALGHNCDTTTDPLTAQYKLTISNPECTFIIKTGI